MMMMMMILTLLTRRDARKGARRVTYRRTEHDACARQRAPRVVAAVERCVTTTEDETRATRCGGAAQCDSVSTMSRRYVRATRDEDEDEDEDDDDDDEDDV